MHLLRYYWKRSIKAILKLSVDDDNETVDKVAMEMSEREDNFGNGIFWEYYKDLEHQFENFLEYVPYLCGNENTYSFRLANIILAIGAHVDSAFKEIAKYPEFFSKYPEIFKRKDGKQKNLP